MKALRMIGLGGQGVVTAGQWLSEALGNYEEQYIKTLPAFGHERRGALVTCDMYISSEPILIHSFISNADLLCCYSPESYRLYEKGHDTPLSNTMLLISNTDPRELLSRLRKRYSLLFVLDRQSISSYLKNRHMDNVFALAALSRLHWVNAASLERVLKSRIAYTEDISQIMEEVYGAVQEV
jgi:Pyruvate/2-oxoacid:ferredoxin oxidoreductase gamma subunit